MSDENKPYPLGGPLYVPRSGTETRPAVRPNIMGDTYEYIRTGEMAPSPSFQIAFEHMVRTGQIDLSETRDNPNGVMFYRDESVSIVLHNEPCLGWIGKITTADGRVLETPLFFFREKAFAWFAASIMENGGKAR